MLDVLMTTAGLPNPGAIGTSSTTQPSGAIPSGVRQMLTGINLANASSKEVVEGTSREAVMLLHLLFHLSESLLVPFDITLQDRNPGFVVLTIAEQHHN
jgi:hypothetical protein